MPYKPDERLLCIGIDASRAQTKMRSGTENYSYHLIRALAALERRHQIRLYLRKGSQNPFSGLPVECKLLGPQRLWTHIGLAGEMLREAPDVLFVPAHVLPAWRPHCSVVTVHDLGYLYYASAHKRSRWWYLHLSTAFHSRIATRLIADSEATKRDLVKWYGTDPNKITVVHLAVDEAFKQVTDKTRLAEVRQRYAGRRSYLLFVGTVQPRKNVRGLLEAYAALRQRMADPPALVIAGRTGWLAASIYSRAEELGLGDDVKFVDFVAETDMPALISGALALVFPSFYEGFGLPALEAMACGTPVVASNSSSLPEVVGDAGILVDPHDVAELAQAMESVASDAALRADLREKGLRRARQFTWQGCAQQTMLVLEAAVG